MKTEELMTFRDWLRFNYPKEVYEDYKKTFINTHGKDGEEGLLKKDKQLINELEPFYYLEHSFPWSNTRYGFDFWNYVNEAWGYYVQSCFNIPGKIGLGTLIVNQKKEKSQKINIVFESFN